MRVPLLALAAHCAVAHQCCYSKWGDATTGCGNYPVSGSGGICDNGVTKCNNVDDCSKPTPSPSPPQPTGPKVAGGYLMMQRSADGGVVGLQELQAVAANAATVPVNRIWVAFFSPTMVYKQGSSTFADTGMETGSDAADLGFAEVKEAIKTLQDNGVEVFLSMGGWNYNCFPALYTRYSIGGYGTHTPNYWKIQEYGQGNVDNCNEANMWCWSCEPESEGTTLDSFSIFPEPKSSDSWEKAKKYIEGKAGGKAPEWHSDMAPGEMWTESKTGTSLKIPGSSKPNDMGRDPYVDFVYLAKDLGAAGIDLDYEEFWHADYFRSGPETGGPWELHQTVYKYSAIAKDMLDTIDAVAPSMKLTTAAGAVGAWDGKWWGGNLKGVWLKAKQWFPDVMSRVQVNVMTYDLSSNNEFHECPESNVCTLDQQVEYYMKNYRDGGFSANVGYEVGQPAYPDPTHDKSHQLPLAQDKLAAILDKTQPQHPGGFFWEMYKTGAGEATATQVAQQLCRKVLGDAPRCSGKIPEVGPGPSPTPSPSPSPSPSPECLACHGSDNCYHATWAVPCSSASDQSACEESSGEWCGAAPPSPTPTPSPVPTPPAPTPAGGKFRCTSNQCVAAVDGIAEDLCKSVCGEQTYKCINNQCTAADGGVAKDTCVSFCGGFIL